VTPKSTTTSPAGPTSGMPLLECRGVEVAYDSVQVLFGVDLRVDRGEIVALLGTNGAGKSTLLRAVSQLIEPLAGTISFDGHDLTHAGPIAATRHGIVHVPGGKAVFPTLSVADHFKTTRWLIPDTDAGTIDQRTEEVLDRFPRLRERWLQLAGDLSGGEQQQLALAIAFVANPTLLIIDELSLGLAPKVVEELLAIVRHMHDLGATVLLVEQSVNVALTIADRAYFMEKGEVQFSGATAELLDRPDILRSVFIEGAASRTSATLTSRPDQHVDTPAAPGGHADVLTVEGLRRRYGGVTAVDDVTFTVSSGQILGLIGPNGAGKTTIFDLICGFTRPDSGTVCLDGIDITGWSSDRRARNGLGRSFQDARIFPSLTVAENLAIGLDRHLTDRDHVAAFFGLPAIREMETHVAYTVHDLIDLMGLGAYRNKFVGELSTGTRRVVDLAMSIAHDPKVLLLDEPSSGIAQRETEALGPLLLRIRDETSTAILVIEHDMPLISAVSDEIVALEVGRVVTRGRPAEVLADPRVIASYLGGDPEIVHRSGVRRRRRRPLEANR
jgi:ABC-type branched-subunit amino acid transport system ATPase component